MMAEKFHFYVGFGGRFCIPGVAGERDTLDQAITDARNFAMSQCPRESNASWKVYSDSGTHYTGSYSRGKDGDHG